MQFWLNLIIISLCSPPPPPYTAMAMPSNPDTASFTMLTITRTLRAPNVSDSNATPASQKQYQFSVKSFNTIDRAAQVEQLERRINAHHPVQHGVEAAMRLQGSAAKNSPYVAVGDIFCSVADRELFINDVDELSSELLPRTRGPCAWKGCGRPGTANEGMPGKTKARTEAKRPWNQLQTRTLKCCLHQTLRLTPERSTCVFLSIDL